jgi:hypothetical protein
MASDSNTKAPVCIVLVFFSMFSIICALFIFDCFPRLISWARVRQKKYPKVF